MNYKIKTLPEFEKRVKKLLKKYPSIKSDIAKLILLLEINPTQGVSLGNNCYKARMSITSKGKGKYGGARVITYILNIQTEVYLLTMYDKSETDSFSVNEINDLLSKIPKSDI